MITVCLLCSGHIAAAQKDSVKPAYIDSFLRNRKGFIGDLTKNLLASAPKPVDGPELQRTDQRFLVYGGREIRHVYISSLDFGVSIGDTSKVLNNKLTHLVNNMHHKTRERVIRNHLFFRERTKLVPLMLGINERHLRDLSFIQEARIIVQPAFEDSSFVDIIVLTKDAFSWGGGVKISEMDKGELDVQQDNFLGYGDRLKGELLFDASRRQQWSWGAAFVRRNIHGSFIDVSAGHREFQGSFISGRPEEAYTYVALIRPLAHPYLRWTYAAEISEHNSRNQYEMDSTYQLHRRYRYITGDVWGGINLRAGSGISSRRGSWFSWLISARMIHKKFLERPATSSGRFFYRFVDFSAMLGSISLFRQQFYKTNYIYGFGRNEDVPEGVEASLISGMTWKNRVARPYVGFDGQWYYFTPSQKYVKYTLRAGSYWHRSAPEDIDLLAGIEYFSRLHTPGKRWKLRNFLQGSFGQQWNYRFNEPLMVESKYGLPGYKNDNVAGDLRASIGGESVFFSPWSVLYFKMAPFVFGSVTSFRYNDSGRIKTPVFTAIGAGLRVQNESLIFGTIELKATHYPRPGFTGEQWRIDLNTNLRYRFNTIFVKKPELVTIN